MVGQGVALLLGALVSAAVTRGLSPEVLDSWGWRIPFLFGLLIAPVGIYIRRHLDETEAFIEANATPRQEVGLGTLIATHFSEAMVCLGLATGQTIQAYVILLYMPTFATTQFGLPLGEALTAQSIGLACLIVAVPLSGALSDHVGRKPIMIGAYVLYLSFAYPMFAWVYQGPSIGRLMIMQAALCSLHGVFWGPFSTAFAEQFPVRIRSTACGIAYNVAIMAFGGFAPFFVTWLVQATGSPIAPVFYVMFGAAVGLVAAWFMVDRAREARLVSVETVLS
jgi:MFS transporter, MHS family, proline/betaine transporter